MKLFRAACLIALIWIWLHPADAIPVPDPSPHVDPIDSGVAVLIVEETAQRKNLPESQIQILRGAPFAAWLQQKQVSYRIWDQDLDPQDAPEGWRKALQQSRRSLPWIYITNGRRSFSGPLPETVEATQALILKYL